MSLGLIRNNPGCILASPDNRWQGMAQVQPVAGPVAFLDMVHGIRALYLILASYEKEGITTISAAIDRYSPPNVNNSAAYIADVCRRCGINATTAVSLTAIAPQLIKAICWHENGEMPLTDSQIQQAIELAQDS